ncbi:BET1-like protein [Amphiura filiformis]|uniref:BET1-like protein n=1 Tax=Amphiura filiformis TaxID=82378 RepID=UPI003B2225D9
MADRGSRRNGWGNGGGAAGTEDMLESENNRLSQGLAAKVSTLKSLAMDIDEETKNQNVYLDGMGDDFQGTEGLLGGTVRRFDTMLGTGRQNRKLMCYLILFIVLIFILAYFLVGRVTRA